jgi:lipopolysaccharide transport system ATP-binding protein
MSDVVITAEHVWKEYRLGSLSHHSLVMDMQSWWARCRGKEDPNSRIPVGGAASQRDGAERFLALQDVSFEIKRGDLVGIIGRNGAGKSTLLKILSRVTTPTRGQITIKGRVASLLEVGTGFHPELTGRENVFLNGAILGMKKDEIKRKFDEIVAFSEVEKFIDTPVKRYSSGMYVRLAFGVAAHLEPEILIVDEVLAVGDAQFQQKCLGKMQEVGKEGRTVLFVSHNMGAINRLCKSCIWLKTGQIEGFGLSDIVIDNYMTGSERETTERIWDSKKAPGNDVVKLRSVRIYNESAERAHYIRLNEPTRIEMEVEIFEHMQELAFSIKIVTSDGTVLVQSSDVMSGSSLERQAGIHKVICTLPAYLLNAGHYSLTVASDIPYKQIMFLEECVLRWESKSTCAKMGRYQPSEWKGLVGPGITEWDESIINGSAVHAG